MSLYIAPPDEDDFTAETVLTNADEYLWSGKIGLQAGSLLGIPWAVANINSNNRLPDDECRTLRLGASFSTALALEFCVVLGVGMALKPASDPPARTQAILVQPQAAMK